MPGGGGDHAAAALACECRTKRYGGAGGVAVCGGILFDGRPGGPELYKESKSPIMKSLRLMMPIAAVAALVLAGNAFATVELSKKEKKPCTTCHEKGKPTKEKPLLNAIGQFYKEKGTLEGAPKK